LISGAIFEVGDRAGGELGCSGFLCGGLRAGGVDWFQCRVQSFNLLHDGCGLVAVTIRVNSWLKLQLSSMVHWFSVGASKVMCGGSTNVLACGGGLLGAMRVLLGVGIVVGSLTVG